jgi:hypothetical protein
MSAVDVVLVRREALLIRVEVRDRPPLTLSQQGGEAEGSLIREAPGRAGAALTKPGRASTARWCGSGERGEKEYARNQRLRLSTRLPAQIWRIGAGSGAYPPLMTGGELLGGLKDVRLGGHGDVLRGSRGEAAGTELGSSFAERIAVNTGTVPGLPGACAASAWVRAGPAVG